jgi:hypothetical protein
LYVQIIQIKQIKTIVTFLTSSDTLMTVDSNSSKNAFGVTTGSNNSCTPSLIVSSIVTPVQWLVDGIGASFGTGTGTGTDRTERDTLLLLVLTLLTLLLLPTPCLLVGKVAAPPPAVVIARCVALLASINALAEKKSAIGPLSRT